MMNFKKILALIVSAIIICSCMVFNVSAASATIAFSSNSPKVGETVTVSVTVQGTEAMYSTDFNVSYNPNVLRFESGDSANGGAGSIKIASGVSGANKHTYTLKFTAIAAGSSPISASGGAYYMETDDAISGSATINVSDVTKSSNANLSALRVSAGSISPRFSQNVTEYTVNVKKNVTECKVYGTTADKDATISITGSAQLKIGENKRVLTVTAPSGAQKSYTLTIIRSDVDEPDESDTSSTAEVPSALETIIGGASFVVLKDISSVELPVGFNVTKRLYNNEEITVAIDDKENYELFYLKSADGEEIAPYTYDENKNAFKRVQIITQGSNSYIVAEIPDDLTVPKEYTAKSVKIQEMNISAYKSEDEALKDMYYIYCYFGGEYNMYRYDTVENVLQRSPEFELISAERQTQTSNIEFLNRFNKLSANAKTIVVCLCVAFVGIVALVVLAIIKLVRHGRFVDFDLDEETEDFSSVTFNDNYEINTEDKE